MVPNQKQLKPLTRMSLLWLLKFDGSGFVIALSLAAKIASREEVFLLFLVGFSLFHYLGAARHWLSLRYARINSRRFFAVPALAASNALIVCALTRSYYSAFALLIFMTVWSIWIIAVRVFFVRRLPPVKALVIGAPPFEAELRRAPRLQLVSLTTPPDTFSEFDLVIFDSLALYSEEWLQWMLHANLAGVKVMSAAVVIEGVTGRVPTEMLSGRWAPSLLHGRSTYTLWKRAFDLLLILFLLPFLLCLGLVVALAVYVSDGCPILFWQERVGKNGKSFKMVKFRSMKLDAEQGGAAFTATDDPRITHLGAFLRRSRLDEIPQFYNVLRGEMSIIGPRPEQRAFVENFSKEIPLYEIRHRIRPGITGWAQVTHGYTAEADETREKLRRDFYYVKNCSLWLDLYITLKTVTTVLSGFGSR